MYLTERHLRANFGRTSSYTCKKLRIHHSWILACWAADRQSAILGRNLVTGRTAGAQSRRRPRRSAIGRAILDVKMTLESISDGAIDEGIDPQPRSGHQERIENTTARYIYG